MNEQQVTDFMLHIKGEISSLWESLKSAHKRVDENDKMTAGIHELAKNIATMATEIKLLSERLNSSIERMESGQKSQGERIGKLEYSFSVVERMEKALTKLADKIETIEKEPAAKWKGLVTQVITLVVGAVFAMIVARLM